MKIGVAAIRGTYQGKIKIVDKDEPTPIGWWSRARARRANLRRQPRWS